MTSLAQLEPFAVEQPVTVREAVVGSLTSLWDQLVRIVPSLIAATIIIVAGWLIAVAAGRLVERILTSLRINDAFERMSGVKTIAARAHLTINIPLLLGEIIKWLILIVTLLTASDVMGLSEVSQFLLQILLYIPNVIIAATIMVVAILLANFVFHAVAASVRAADFSHAAAIATLAKWAIIIFAAFAALLQLNVAVALIQTFLTAFFAMIALAGGLAFGLGGKDIATHWIKKIESELTGRK